MARATRTVTNAPGIKFYAAIVGATLTYLLTQQVVDWPAYVDVALNAAAVGLAVWAAPPQRTVSVCAIPGAFILFGAAGAAGLHTLILVIIVLFLLAALYVGIRMHEWVGAVVLVLLAVIIGIFLL